MFIDTNLATDAGRSALINGSGAAVRTATQNGVAPAGDTATDVSAIGPATTAAAQISSSSAAQSALGDAMSFTQTQDGYLQSIGAALAQMGELASAAQDPATTDADRASLGAQFQSLAVHIHHASTRSFNGVSLFSAAPVSVPSGGDDNETLSMPGVNLNAPAYAAAANASVDSSSGSEAIATALDQLSADRHAIGSFQAQIGLASERLSDGLNGSTGGQSIMDGTDADLAMDSVTAVLASQPGVAFDAQAHQSYQSAARLLPA